MTIWHDNNYIHCILNSDSRHISMDTFTVNVNVRKLFGFYNNALYNDRTKPISNIETLSGNTKLDWFQQTHGGAEAGTQKKEASQ